MIGVGVIGYGYWGPNLARNFAHAEGSCLRWVCDLQPERLAQAQKVHPTAKTTSDFRDLLRDPAVDAVAIATPMTTHYDLALEALRAGRHVLVEKPIAAAPAQALRLIEEAQRRATTLMVDHTFVFHGAVRRIRELARSGELGSIYYYDSVRVNLGLFQNDANVLWDLAVHDLSIMDYALSDRPRAVSAHGISHFPGQPANMAYLTLFFDGNLVGHLHVNWLSPVKVRRTLIGGSRKMIVYDDLEPTEKIKIYDRGITVRDDAESRRRILYDYRMGDMVAPRLDGTEPLCAAVNHFLDCIARGAAPITDGLAGLRLVRILEAATASIAAKGALVELDMAPDK